ncbi:MAG: metal-dependent transcriptional regulator [Candidatus Bathyarchaeota archaeon]|nr:metal-dependent transcriptional regulator [Candidatus Bathyarchaeota archaeon]
MNMEITGKGEDYLRGIYEITQQKGFARIRDIADHIAVKPSSAVEMVRKLDKLQLVRYEKYGGVTLTTKGKEMAEVIEKRHETFKKFLEIILVPKNIALKDAHVLEHRLQPRTILQFSKFVDFIENAQDNPKFLKKWRIAFKKYCESKVR